MISVWIAVAVAVYKSKALALWNDISLLRAHATLLNPNNLRVKCTSHSSVWLLNYWITFIVKKFFKIKNVHRVESHRTHACKSLQKEVNTSSKSPVPKSEFSSDSVSVVTGVTVLTTWPLVASRIASRILICRRDRRACCRKRTTSLYLSDLLALSTAMKQMRRTRQLSRFQSIPRHYQSASQMGS